MDLTGRTAIVTGGAVRLGRAIAIAIAEQGCDVILHYGNSETAAKETADEISALGVRCLTVQADFRDPVTAARGLFDAALAEFARVDFLINSAAIFEPSTLNDLDEDHWDRHFAVNLKAPAFLAREFDQRRKTAVRGHIINIADWRAQRPVPGHLAYTLTKSGLVSLTKILAQELGPDVQVNAVAPGSILPPPDADASYLDQLADRNPLKRTGNVKDITDAVLYLLRSDFVNGEVLHITGGEQL